jgi:hypothetical protein
MQYPPVPPVDAVASQFMLSLRNAERAEIPYRRWKLREVFPIDAPAS